MKQCKCEHWQQCPTCMPHRFDAEGNLKPPEPTPLQACQSQVSALTRALFQAQKAVKNLAKREWVGYTKEDRERIVPMLVQSLINHDEKTMVGLLNAILIDIEQQLREKNT